MRFDYHHFDRDVTETEARVLYVSDSRDDWFSVIAFADDVPDAGVPEYSIEIVPPAKFFRVHFYDQAKSLRFVYDFDTIEGRLFLENITEYTYSDTSRMRRRNESLVTESLTFKPDGTMHQRKNDKAKDYIEEADYRGTDVSSHWENVPAFGEWESIARFIR